MLGFKNSINSWARSVLTVAVASLYMGCGGGGPDQVAQVNKPSSAKDAATIRAERERALSSNLLPYFAYDAVSLEYTYIILVSSAGLDSAVNTVSGASMTLNGSSLSILNNGGLAAGAVSSDLENSISGLKTYFGSKLDEAKIRSNPSQYYQLALTVPNMKAGSYKFDFTLRFSDGGIATISTTQVFDRDLKQ